MKTILYLGSIDDDTSVLYTLEAMAKSQGWDMRTTTEPDEAFLWVINNQIDILLVDYHMPKMSGLEVIQRAREISDTVVLLVLTIEEHPQIARQLLLAGADDFVNKPVRLLDFASRIQVHAKLAHYRKMTRQSYPMKGISEETLRKVIDLLVSNADTEFFDVQFLCDNLGLAYPTAHRYLEYLVAKGTLFKSQESPEGKPGRPRTLYQMK